jgi:hypothetical protein
MLSNSKIMRHNILGFLVVVSFFYLFSIRPVSAWYTENHQRISKTALALLPDWEKGLLGSAVDSLAELYCMYPDWHRSALRDEDSVKIALYNPYVQLSLLQDLGAWHNTSDENSEVCFYIVSTLMHQAVKNLQIGNTIEAAKYMGPLLHFIEDNACPVHVVNNQLLSELLPTPQELMPFPLHRRVEEPTFPFEVFNHQVSLLGTNIIDAANTFYPRFQDIRLTGRAQSVPILEAIYAGDEQKANQGRARAATPAIKLIADVIHTICTIAKNGK